jgi:hypothetical protein
MSNKLYRSINKAKFMICYFAHGEFQGACLGLSQDQDDSMRLARKCVGSRERLPTSLSSTFHHPSHNHTPLSSILHLLSPGSSHIKSPSRASSNFDGRILYCHFSNRVSRSTASFQQANTAHRVQSQPASLFIALRTSIGFLSIARLPCSADPKGYEANQPSFSLYTHEEQPSTCLESSTSL